MWLFWPPVMLVVAGVGLAALAWLYTIHGLAPAVIQVLAEPVLLPIALILAFLGALAEGLGPMAALYSSGATLLRLRILPRLPAPTFALDVDNDYGFSRWSRLTVNAGGVYLLLVLALVLCLLGAVTGADFLFLTVALLTLTMVRLLLPFGRPGADRLLADLLLVPEPLTYARQALARRVPKLGIETRALPPLKRWGEVTILLYLLAVAWVLLYVGLALLWVTPTVLTTAAAALRAYLGGMLAAVGERDVLGLLGSSFKLGVLGLMCFVLAVGGIVAVCRFLLKGARWAGMTPRRRIVGAAGAALMAVLLALMWLPTNAFSASVREGRAAPRSVLGAAWASLTPYSRGALADLFEPPFEPESVAEPVRGDAADGATVQPAGSPVVNVNVGTGPVDAGPPSTTQATGGGGGAAGGASGGNGGATGSGNVGATSATAPKPGTARGATPESAGGPGGQRGTLGPSGQNAPSSNTSGGTSAGPESASAGAPNAEPAGQTTAGSGTAGQNAPSSDSNGVTSAAHNAPNNTANTASRQQANQPGAQTGNQTGNQPAAQPASKPSSGTANGPATKPNAGSTGPGSGARTTTAASGQQQRRPASAPVAKPANNGTSGQQSSGIGAGASSTGARIGAPSAGGASVTVNGSRARPTPAPSAGRGANDNGNDNGSDEASSPGVSPTPR
jgi:hypothetical protein